MANTLPPIPLKTPIVDSRGYLTAAWSAFFVQLFNRVGGNIAKTNIELEDLPELELGDLETDVAALQLLVTSQGNEIDTLESDVGQGPIR